MQIFDLKVKYQFQTTPGVDKYNMPLYNVQTEPGSQDIGMFPVYQGFVGPAIINGVNASLETRKEAFYYGWTNGQQNLQVVGVGNGGATYTLQLPILGNFPPPINPPIQGILRGHIDITGIISTGNNIDPPIADTLTAITSIPLVPVTSVDAGVFISSIDATGANVIVTDSGQFLSGNVNYGILMQPGKAPNGNLVLPGAYGITENTINYLSGIINVTFPVNIPVGQNISVKCNYFNTGLPRAILFYNNTLTLRNPPDTQYLIELDAYLSPAAFLNTEKAIHFGYMSEYIARGAARKILSDTGDVEQFMFYEPLFKEQELLVWKRSQRQWTNNRTQTIYSQGMNMGQTGNFFGGTNL